ncbi:Sphinganine C4-monooxygenase 1, partial [Cucurbita argyrosperma subsp. argyrosperma]
MVALQLVTAMFVLDTWQYFAHRYMHHNKFLYRHIHSHHHRLVVPYAFGALYNHPVEESPSSSFPFATIKTVDDHCGLWLPGNLFHLLFRNNTAYHDLTISYMATRLTIHRPFLLHGIESWYLYALLPGEEKQAAALSTPKIE